MRQSMALHIFGNISSLTQHLLRNIMYVASKIFRVTIKHKPICDFWLFPKHVCKRFWSNFSGMASFLNLHSALHIPSPFLEQLHHRQIFLKASAMLIGLCITSWTLCLICAVRSTCTLSFQCSVKVTWRLCHTVQTDYL
jgi:hypothetical protein